MIKLTETQANSSKWEVVSESHAQALYEAGFTVAYDGKSTFMSMSKYIAELSKRDAAKIKREPIHR
jgi:hypothetical protein